MKRGICMSDETIGFVLETDAARLLKEYNIPYPEHGLSQSAEDAVKIANRVGYPVVLKVVSSQILHKSDVGGVMVDLTNAEQVRNGFQKIYDRILAAETHVSIKGLMVCHQAAEGLEAIVGAYDDSVFGPTVMFGLGGVFAELFQDVSFRIAPLKRVDAEEMIQEIKGYPLIIGVRGRTMVDTKHLIDLILNVSRLVTEHSEIIEFDLNPVRLYKDSLLALDVRLIKKEEK
jgi:acyl-CoA synthetase (NDP forming)